jgi:DNA-binding transcriptional regulator LsrR (DeoR family)
VDPISPTVKNAASQKPVEAAVAIAVKKIMAAEQKPTGKKIAAAIGISRATLYRHITPARLRGIIASLARYGDTESAKPWQWQR